MSIKWWNSSLCLSIVLFLCSMLATTNKGIEQNLMEENNPHLFFSVFLWCDWIFTHSLSHSVVLILPSGYLPLNFISTDSYFIRVGGFLVIKTVSTFNYSKNSLPIISSLKSGISIFILRSLNRFSISYLLSTSHWFLVGNRLCKGLWNPMSKSDSLINGRPWDLSCS